MTRWRNDRPIHENPSVFDPKCEPVDWKNFPLSELQREKRLYVYSMFILKTKVGLWMLFVERVTS